jgi:hypothetical protein
MLRCYRFLFLKFYKSLSYGFALSSGRNFFGRICVQHQGGGHKHKFLLVDRFRKLNQFGFILELFVIFFGPVFLGLSFMIMV